MAARYLGKGTVGVTVASAMVLGALYLGGCFPLEGAAIPHVEYFRQPSSRMRPNWLQSVALRLEPFSSGSIHTPASLAALPAQFRARFPETASYRPLWARERDVAVFLYDAIGHSLERLLRIQLPATQLYTAPSREAIRWYYHASADLGLGEFRAVLFDPRASRLGDASTGNDRLAPFRKAFLIRKQALRDGAVRIVTGYLGLHCAHELVGRSNKDVVSTKLDWLVALVDDQGSVIAQAYVGTSSTPWQCPLSDESWDELIDALAEQMVTALIVPATDTAPAQR